MRDILDRAFPKPAKKVKKARRPKATRGRGGASDTSESEHESSDSDSDDSSSSSSSSGGEGEAEAQDKPSQPSRRRPPPKAQDKSSQASRRPPSREAQDKSSQASRRPPSREAQDKSSQASRRPPSRAKDEPSQQELRRKAQEGSAHAQVTLGQNLYHGTDGFEKDAAEAFRWLAAVAKQDQDNCNIKPEDHQYAVFSAAQVAHHGLENSKDAIRLYLQVIKGPTTEYVVHAQTDLAMLYQSRDEPEDGKSW